MKQSYTEPGDLLESGEEESFNLRAWIMKMLRSWPYFLLSLIICLSLAFLYLRVTPPVYSSFAAVMVKDEKKGAELMDNDMLKGIGLGSNNKLVENEIEILKSYDLVDSVVYKLQLFVKVRKAGQIKKHDLFENELPFQVQILNPDAINEQKEWQISKKNGRLTFSNETVDKPIAIEMGQTYASGAVRFKVLPNPVYSETSIEANSTADGDFDVIVDVPADITEAYIRNLSVEATSKSATVINLELKDSNKKRGVSFIETMLSIYNGQSIADKNRVSDNTVDFLSNRLGDVQSGLQSVEGSVEKFKSENRVTDLSTDAQQYIAASQEVDMQKAASQTQLNIVNALEEDLASTTTPKLVPSTLGIAEPVLGELIAKHNELILQQERLIQRSGPKNPLLIDLQDQVKELRSSLLANVRNLKQAYQISLNDVSRKDAQLNSKIRNVPAMEKKLVQITRNQTVQEQLYAFLLQKKEEAEITRASNLEDARTIVKARSLGKISPRQLVVWALALVLAMLLPIGYFALKDGLNNTVGDASEIDKKTGAPLLGTLNFVSKINSPIVINTSSRTIIAEQIRSIRTGLSYTTKTVKTILITSYQPGDGKSFVSLNLGASYALLNKKTIILEFDLRKPQIAKSLGMELGEGLSNFLSGKSTLDKVIKELPGHDGNLFLLTAGYLPPNPSELISGPKMIELIETLKERYDFVIIDTPPFSVVTDATLLQRYADATLIVLRQDYTDKNSIREVRKMINSKPDSLIYLLLNGVGKNKKYASAYTTYNKKFGKGYYIEEA